MDLRKVSHFLRKIRGVPYCGAVIVAAGNASRMEGIDKILAPLEGIPVIQRTAQAFQDCAVIREVVIVTREDRILPAWTKSPPSLPGAAAVRIPWPWVWRPWTGG